VLIRRKRSDRPPAVAHAGQQAQVTADYAELCQRICPGVEFVNSQLQFHTRTASKAKRPFQAVRGGLLRRKCACGGKPGPTGECEECRKKRLSLQRHSLDEAWATTVPPIVHEVRQSPGPPFRAEHTQLHGAALRASLQPGASAQRRESGRVGVSYVCACIHGRPLWQMNFQPVGRSRLEQVNKVQMFRSIFVDHAKYLKSLATAQEIQSLGVRSLVAS
jgi:hypothetical protein